MKTLVTGATGFIGSHLVEELLKRGHNVTCLVRKTSNLQWIDGLNVRVIYGDCAIKESLLNTVADFDYIFHLAGLTKAVNEKDFFSVNALGTENLVSDVIEKNPDIKRFVYLSSLAAAGPSHNSSPLKETDEPNPVSAYGRSKLEGERIVMRHKNTIPVTIIRPPAVYGPRDKDIYILFKLLKKGISLCWGKCYYSLLYVDDLVKGTMLSAESKTAEGEIFYLSDGRIYSNEEITEAIASTLGSKPVRLRIPRSLMPMLASIGQKLGNQSNIINKDKIRELQQSYWTCDSTKSRNELGFIPNVGIKEGVKWTADWYRIHQWL
ncbi:MAG: NAD-dependent epimerase/dehydratase family protein [Thermodesulfovibrionales bacterium]|nr:NAD-dependent epimerase/dehydratase family protein [Thermodesulfovibrionales bacterium]